MVSSTVDRVVVVPGQPISSRVQPRQAVVLEQVPFVDRRNAWFGIHPERIKAVVRRFELDTNVGDEPALPVDFQRMTFFDGGLSAL